MQIMLLLGNNTNLVGISMDILTGVSEPNWAFGLNLQIFDIDYTLLPCIPDTKKTISGLFKLKKICESQFSFRTKGWKSNHCNVCLDQLWHCTVLG